MRGVDGLERVVLGLQADAVRLPEEPLDRGLVGRLVAARERDDHVAVLGVLLAANDDVVAVEDAGVHHRVAAYPEDELVTTARERLRNAEVALDRLLGQHRAAGRDLAYERQHVRLGRRPRGTAPLTPDQLECARLRRVTPQQPGTLEV